MAQTSGLEGLRLISGYVAAALVVLGALAAILWFARRPLASWLRSLTADGHTSDGLVALVVLFALAEMAFFASLEVIATSLFFAGRGISWIVVVLATPIAAVLLLLAARALLTRARWLSTFAVVAGVCVALTVGSLWGASRIYDVSWDGQWIHQQAAVVLANGWNPVADPIGLTAGAGEWRPDLTATEWTIGIQNFSKGLWIRTGAIYAFTHNIESSKAGNIILMFVAFGVWFALALSRAPRRWFTALVVGALVTFNPITVVQMLTHKNDGHLGSLFAIAVGLGCLAITGVGGWPALLAACFALLMLCTIKFTGLVYAVVLVVGAVVVIGAFRTFRERKVLLGSLVATLLIATLFVGYNPYVFNTRYYGHPFYPLMGAGAVDTLTEQSPRDFANISNPERLFRSLFSKAEDELLGGSNPVTTQLKVPFTIQASELRPYLGFDTRVAGFGPLFGGALIIVALLLALLGVEYWRTRRRGLGAGLLLVIVLGVSVAANPAAWWARYAPQIWLLAAVVAALALLTWKSGPRAWAAFALCAVLFADVAFVGTINFANVVHGTNEITASLDSIQKWPGGAIVEPGMFATGWTKLEERRIRWRLRTGRSGVATGVVIPYTTVTASPATAVE